MPSAKCLLVPVGNSRCACYSCAGPRQGRRRRPDAQRPKRHQHGVGRGGPTGGTAGAQRCWWNLLASLPVGQSRTVVERDLVLVEPCATAPCRPLALRLSCGGSIVTSCCTALQGVATLLRTGSAINMHLPTNMQFVHRLDRCAVRIGWSRTRGERGHKDRAGDERMQRRGDARCINCMYPSVSGWTVALRFPELLTNQRRTTAM